MLLEPQELRGFLGNYSLDVPRSYVFRITDVHLLEQISISYR